MAVQEVARPPFADEICLEHRSENFCRVRRSKFPAHDSGESCIGRKTKGMSKMARFLLPTEVSDALHFCKSAWSEVLMEDTVKSDHDLYSAVTFFLVGVGVGSVLALVFNPRHRIALEGINTWRRAA